MTKGYVAISIPEGVCKAVKRYMRKSKRYTSMSDFFTESARLRLEKLEKY
jgi:hypothetical protein